MKKNTLALAVLGTLAAPAAFAQSANPVTLYGRIYGVFESVEAKGGTSPVVRRSRVSDNSSYLGVRGTEDLGGGLKAFFQLETAFAIDANTTTFAARNSAVGLQGGLGSVMVGRWDTPFKLASSAIDPFVNVTIGAYSMAMSGSGVNNVAASNAFDRREVNSVQYWSPNWNGFAVRASYSANEAKTATLNPERYSASLTYNNGPIYLGYAYDESKDSPFGAVTPPKQEGNALVGAYTFGPVKVGALVQEFKRTGFAKQKAYMVTGTYTAGKHQFILVHQDAKDGGAVGIAVQPSCKADAAGYQYNFSQRSMFIAQYVRVDNNQTGTCNFGSGNSIAIAAGQDPQGFAIGVRHLF